MRKLLLTLFSIASITLLKAELNQDSLLMVGEKLFKSNCKACHNIDKKLTGPALSKVYERRDSAWIYQFIKGSQKMIKDGDPIATKLFNEFNQVLMPNQDLDNDQIGLILSFIKNNDENKNAQSMNPISRPKIKKAPYSDHFRFSNYIFWIPFTLSIILGGIALYFLTIYHDIIENNIIDNAPDKNISEI